MDKITECEVVKASSARALNNAIKECMAKGWTPVGSHQVVETLRENMFSGDQHKRTTIEHEYSITMIK
jgi:hypothetical protein